jgi:hypothetical protein
MFWWFVTRLASMDFPTNLIDIIHAGLSEEHQEICLADFHTGKTLFLLGSDKIGAGMNFRRLPRVFQYTASGVTIPRWSQRRGQGGPGPGETSTGYLIVEPRMMSEGGLSVEEPGMEDPGMLDLVQSAEQDNRECTDIIFDRWLENPARTEPSPAVRCCCSNCNASLVPGRKLEWIEVNPVPVTESSKGPFRSSAMQKAEVFNQLKHWRLAVWKEDWRKNWPSYGPKTLVSDSDLKCISNQAGSSVFTIQDIRRYTHITHWPELGAPLMNALHAALILVHGSDMLLPSCAEDRGTVRVFEEAAGGEVAADVSESRPSTSKRRRIGALQEYENVMTI